MGIQNGGYVVQLKTSAGRLGLPRRGERFIREYRKTTRTRSRFALG